MSEVNLKEYILTNVYDKGSEKWQGKPRNFPGTLERFKQSFPDKKTTLEVLWRLLKPGSDPARGFTILKDASRLDLSLEAVLFTSDKAYRSQVPQVLLAECKRRLDDAGVYADKIANKSSALFISVILEGKLNENY